MNPTRAFGGVINGIPMASREPARAAWVFARRGSAGMCQFDDCMEELTGVEHA